MRKCTAAAYTRVEIARVIMRVVRAGRFEKNPLNDITVCVCFTTSVCPTIPVHRGRERLALCSSLSSSWINPPHGNLCAMLVPETPSQIYIILYPPISIENYMSLTRQNHPLPRARNCHRNLHNHILAVMDMKLYYEKLYFSVLFC